MDWTREFDGYCERLDPSYWAEPVNALSNAAFLIAAAVMWHRSRGEGLPLAKALVALLAAIGVGSYLFHTHAALWAMLADVVPIVLFALLYLYTANRAYLGLSLWPSVAGAALFLPFSAATIPLFESLPWFRISASYWPLVLAFAGYALWLRPRLPRVARGLAVACALLVASLSFRSADMLVCDALPLGTHFLWHVLNGVLLGWVIEVYIRHENRAR